jgi:hypothetical protein
VRIVCAARGHVQWLVALHEEQLQVDDHMAEPPPGVCAGVVEPKLLGGRRGLGGAGAAVAATTSIIITITSSTAAPRPPAERVGELLAH